MSKIFLRTALAAAVITGGFGLSSAASAANISGAGATFPYPIYSKWAASYHKKTGIGLNYQAIGSGGGIKQIEAKTVTFGASDAPLKPDVQEKHGLLQWPMVMGGIVPVLNVPGIKPGELAIDGPTLADIYLGKITKWNDPALAKLNPKVKLPDASILVVHRSDGSGTTFNFTNYLVKVSPEWKAKVGSAVSVAWPVEGYAGKGNAGVAAVVGNTKNTIGYVEYAYAMQNKMTYMDMVNRAGHRVAPNTPTFQAAAANADWAHAAGFYLILTDQPGAKSWPITASTFILMHKKVKDPAAAAEALKFFSWAFAHGAKQAESLDYIPMPANVVSMIKKKWAAEIKGPDGKPVYNGM